MRSGAANNRRRGPDQAGWPGAAESHRRGPDHVRDRLPARRLHPSRETPPPPSRPKRPSRASRAADKLAAKPEPTTTTVVGEAGQSTTGDNGHGFKKPTTKPAAARKPAAAKPKPAAAVKLAPAKKAPRVQRHRQEAGRVRRHGQDAGRSGRPMEREATGVAREQARAVLASYANYSSCQADDWDAALEIARTPAGGAGNSARAHDPAQPKRPPRRLGGRLSPLSSPEEAAQTGYAWRTGRPRGFAALPPRPAAP